MGKGLDILNNVGKWMSENAATQSAKAAPMSYQQKAQKLKDRLEESPMRKLQRGWNNIRGEEDDE